MQSIKYIPASTQATNASQMTVQTLRSPGATTIIPNTVSGVPTFFYASMGAPHTFTDPVTGETITVISESTAVDFAGHVSSGQLIIDAIAPGYTDTRGSLVGDIIVVRPVTAWADNIFNILSQSLNDDGTIKASAMTSSPNVADYVQSGGAWSVLATLNATMTALTGWQAGLQGTIAAVATRAFTASKDTYVDVLRTTTGYTTVFTLVYTEVANGATNPALAANSFRLAKVQTDGTGIIRIDQNGYDLLGNPIGNIYPVIPPTVQDTGVLTPGSAGWNYIKMRPGYKRIEIQAHFLGTGSSPAGPTMQFGFKTTNSGTPSASHFINETFIGNTNTVGRNAGANQVYFASCYSNASGLLLHGTLKAIVDKNNSQQHGATLLSAAYEQMFGMSVNNFGTDWLQLGYLGINVIAAANVTYTITYYR